jgi:hypothetical protein
VVVRKWNNRDYGPGGKTVFLTNAPVDKPLQPFDDYDDRSLIENGCIKESKQQWSLQHPPQKTARAVRVHVLFTLLMFALATAYRLQCEHEETGGEPVGWQRWRRRLLEHTRDLVIVFAQGAYGIFHMAEYSLLLGVTIKDRPPGIGTRQQILAKYGLTAHGGVSADRLYGFGHFIMQSHQRDSVGAPGALVGGVGSVGKAPSAIRHA